RNAVIPNGPTAAVVRANTMIRSAIGALVMKVLRPFTTYPSSRARAVHAIANTSEPASGSVAAWQPIASPEHSRGSHRDCCSLEPNSVSGITLVHRWALIEK